jgi:hypothetical protein
MARHPRNRVLLEKASAHPTDLATTWQGISAARQARSLKEYPELISERVSSLYNELWKKVMEHVPEGKRRGYDLSTHEGAGIQEVVLSGWSGQGNKTSKPVSKFGLTLDQTHEKHIWAKGHGVLWFLPREKPIWC